MQSAVRCRLYLLIALSPTKYIVYFSAIATEASSFHYKKYKLRAAEFPKGQDNWRHPQ